MISVCMATYNGERFIKEQIDSILSQLSENDELIISDDGSTDRTLEIIVSFNDSRIKLLHHKHNPAYEKIKHSRSFYYATDNFENALKEAKGDYIFLSDQDDVWAADRVKKMVAELQNHDLVMCNFSVIDENGDVIQEKFYSVSPISKNVIKNIIASKFLGSALAFSHHVLEYALPFPKNLIGHDLWLGCCGCKSYFFIDESLHFYRRYGNNVSTSTENSKNNFFYKIFWRVVFLLKVIKRKLHLK